MKRNNQNYRTLLLTLFSICLSFALAPTAFATASSPSPERLEKISNGCGSIRNSLKLLQRTDSRARTYFGAIYETSSSKYLTPLNLRLVKNNLSNVDLINLQTSLSSSRADFSAHFIDYSKSLEDLISIDCHLNPEEFYEKLLETREKRALVASDMEKIDTALISSVKTVKTLRDSLISNEKPTSE